MSSKRTRNAPVQPKTPVAAAVASQPKPGTVQQTLVQQRTVFDPDAMRVYEGLHPGASGRLLTLLEQNNASERDARSTTLRIQEAAINAQARDNKRRDWMAYSLIVISLGASGLFAYAGLPWLSGGTFAALIGYVALGFFKWRTH